MSKRVLMIANEFYPCQLVGAHRPSRFCKYLPDFGYETVVVTIDPTKTDWPIDEQLNKQLPASLRRIVTFSPFDGTLKVLIKKVMNAPQRLLHRGKGNESEVSQGTRVCPVFWKLKTWLAVPDEQVYWIPFALPAALPEARRADILFATGAPWGDLVFGYLLKCLTKKKLVVDMRDPWVTNNIRTLPTRFHRMLDAWLESLVLHSADAIINVTESLHKQYMERYPDIPPNRFYLIHNGYDPDDLAALSQPVKAAGKVRIGYFGTVYIGRDPSVLFRAARWALDHGRIAPGTLEFVFFGRTRIEVSKLAASIGVEDIVISKDNIPYTKALQEMAACDVLLVLGSRETDVFLPAKIFEYIGLRKPVIVVSDEGELTNFLRKYQFGMVIGLQDEQNARNALVQIYDDVLAGRTEKYICSDPERFSRRELTRKLAAIFDSVLE